MGRELYKRINASIAPENIYDWLKNAIEKVAPEDNTSAIMEWPASFDIYDAEIQRRIELSQLPEDKRKLFNWPWSSWKRCAVVPLRSSPPSAKQTPWRP